MKHQSYEFQDSSELWSGLRLAEAVAGLAVVLYAAQWFTRYVAALHENHLWFTNIKVRLLSRIGKVGLSS